MVMMEDLNGQTLALHSTSGCFNFAASLCTNGGCLIKTGNISQGTTPIVWSALHLQNWQPRLMKQMRHPLASLISTLHSAGFVDNSLNSHFNFFFFTPCFFAPCVTSTTCDGSISNGQVYSHIPAKSNPAGRTKVSSPQSWRSRMTPATFSS